MYNVWLDQQHFTVKHKLGFDTYSVEYVLYIYVHSVNFIHTRALEKLNSSPCKTHLYWSTTVVCMYMYNIISTYLKSAVRGYDVR